MGGETEIPPPIVKMKLTAYFFLAAFFAGFLAATFFAGFLAANFLAGFLAAAFLAGAFLAGAFLAGAFFFTGIDNPPFRAAVAECWKFCLGSASI